MAAGTIELQEPADYSDALTQILSKIPVAGVSALGHRIVHGGEKFRSPVRVDAAVKAALHELDELAPLHNPPALATLAAAEKVFPTLPQIAVFDTAFYAGLPNSRIVYPLPYAWYEKWRIRRYGFHGISHAYVAGRAAELMKRPPAELNLITCHLGNGCSATAVQGGKAISTTMGFTPMEGLMMGTRSGSVDPGVLLFLEQARGLPAEALNQQLNHASGLLGVSGLSGDFRQVEKAALQGNARARLALTIYADRVRDAIGALAVTLGHVDAVIFTAGVGEHAVELRREVCQGLEILGIHLDANRNESNAPDSDIGRADSRSRLWIIHTREELLIARETRRLLI